MSNTKMLIDATHPEETRVVVQRNGRVEEFDFESAARKLLRGNIYLAKVTRVEPSLQAAFVDYGGNRHGFLAFNEIHPDYYQIPIADRQALIEEEAAAEAELEAAADRRAEALARRAAQRGQQGQRPGAGAAEDEAAGGDENGGDAPHIVDVEEDEHIEEVGGDGADDEAAPTTMAAATVLRTETISESFEAAIESNAPAAGDTHAPHATHHEAEDDESDDDEDESEDGAAEGEGNDRGEDDDEDEGAPQGDGHASAHHSDSHNHAMPAQADQPHAEYHEEAPVRQRRRPRNYKIQEVIKRRQVILVQVVKEERGNKGAALTTYLSLAGRYTVLMPNTARGGGISRKITNPQDRKRLKAIAQELEVPEGMGLIIRTAGAARTKQEIRRDFEYLLRLWESVRDLTLQSTAPSLVYEEGDLIKRSIRDLYNKDVEEVVVAGEAGYQEAADFMRMLMPSHANNVMSYREPTPLFTKYGVERQLNAMFLPQVTLRSGGYIVINQTEALVAIDVNSGKSTREFSIEETALATNLEAAEEIARQLKLRDLAGLIVIDFIDMEEKRNNRAVERKLKDALRFDRARIQLGRISHFGLMEMSRQRLRTGVLEGSTSQCPHCQGTGIIRSTESIALAVLRGLEDAITAGASGPLTANTTHTVALYILNSKRAYVTDMEIRHGHAVTVLGSDRAQGANFTIERGAATAAAARRPERAAVNMNWGFEGDDGEEAPAFEANEIEVVGDDDADDAPRRGERTGRSDGDADGGRKGRRRRRGRGRGRDRGDDRGGYRGERSNGGGSAGEDDDDRAYGAADAPQPVIEDHDDSRDDDEVSGEGQPNAQGGGERSEDGRGRRRRRGRRGGRRGRGDRDAGAPRHGEGDGEGLAATSSEGGDFEPGEAGGDDLSPAPSDVPSSHASHHRGERLWDVNRAQADAPAVEEPHSQERPSSQPASKFDPAAHEPAPVREPVPAAAPEPVPEPVPAPMAEAPRRRHEADSGELRLERVVVRPGDPASPEAADTPADDAAAQPQRKGWWQRRFGG